MNFNDEYKGWHVLTDLIINTGKLKGLSFKAYRQRIFYSSRKWYQIGKY